MTQISSPSPSQTLTRARAVKAEQTIALHDPEATHLPDNTPTTTSRGYRDGR